MSTATNVLGWTYPARELIASLEVAREANAAERAAIAAHLELVSCERFAVRCTLRPLDQGRFVLNGSLEADITQACVVTLDPVSSRLTGAYAVELWPAEELSASDHGAINVRADDSREPIEHGIIDLGRVVLDELADLVDPYPRKPGTTFSWTDAKSAVSDADNPFAKLKNLRRDG